ncbi:MAG: helix-turn-helix domain-containing protein [Eubacteriales bacterium]|nr:helix-turn-helix domain-containing protein [Eubacteriales bacterium]
MNLHVTDALICLKDDFGIEYVVCKIEYKIWETEEFEYRFTPVYPVIDLLDSNTFQGIPGIDLDKRKPEYVRKNIVPTFISERAPSNNREELWKLLESCNMQYLNQLEWLTKTDTHYVGDRLYVRKTTSAYENNITFNKLKRNVDIQKRLLEYICAGRSFSYEGFKIDDSNRSVCYNLLYRLFRRETERIKVLQADGIKQAKADGKYQGRKAIQIDELAFNDVVCKYKNKKISANDAAKKLGISLSTFYRRIKEHNDING